MEAFTRGKWGIVSEKVVFWEEAERGRTKSSAPGRGEGGGDHEWWTSSSSWLTLRKWRMREATTRSMGEGGEGIRIGNDVMKPHSSVL